LKLRKDIVPIKEEKMLCDGLKLVLDNGWTVDKPEMEELMEMCGLKTKVFEDEDFKTFFLFLIEKF
jgi:hypothetical protein